MIPGAGILSTLHTSYRPLICRLSPDAARLDLESGPLKSSG